MLTMKIDGNSKFTMTDTGETIVSKDIADMIEEANKNIKDNKKPDIKLEETLHAE